MTDNLRIHVYGISFVPWNQCEDGELSIKISVSNGKQILDDFTIETVLHDFCASKAYTKAITHDEYKIKNLAEHPLCSEDLRIEDVGYAHDSRYSDFYLDHDLHALLSLIREKLICKTIPEYDPLTNMFHRFYKKPYLEVMEIVSENADEDGDELEVKTVIEGAVPHELHDRWVEFEFRVPNDMWDEFAKHPDLVHWALQHYHARQALLDQTLMKKVFCDRVMSEVGFSSIDEVGGHTIHLPFDAGKMPQDLRAFAEGTTT